MILIPHRQPTETRELNPLAELLDIVAQEVGDGAILVADEGLGQKRGDIGRGEGRHLHRQVVGQLFEGRIFGDEIGFANQFRQRPKPAVAVEISANETGAERPA